MKFNLWQPGDLVYYMGRLYRIRFATATKLWLQLGGSFGDGWTQLDPHPLSQYQSRITVSAKHWSLYRCPS